MSNRKEPNTEMSLHYRFSFMRFIVFAAQSVVLSLLFKLSLIPSRNSG